MFWKRIMELCYEKKTSPTAVCADLGLSNATSTKWKKGAIPRESTLNKLAEYFGVTVDYLLGNNTTGNLNLQLFAAPTVDIKTSDLTEGEIALIKVLDKLTDDEQRQVIEFAEFLISKRGK